MMVEINKNMAEAPHDRRILVWVKKVLVWVKKDPENPGSEYYGWFTAEWELTIDGKERVDARGIPWGWRIGIYECEACSWVSDDQVLGWVDVLSTLPDLE